MNYCPPTAKVVAICTAKGGAGKTTLTIAIASRLAGLGFKIGIIDCDTSADASRWTMDANVTNLQARSQLNPDSLATDIAELKSSCDLVLIDVPGELSIILTYTMVRADFVIVPTNCSEFDINRLTQTVNLLKRTAEGLNRQIPYRVVVNNFPVGAVIDAAARDTEAFISQSSVAAFTTKIFRRPAFQAMVNGAKPLDAIRSNARALDNLDAFISELAGYIDLPVALQDKKEVEHVQ